MENNNDDGSRTGIKMIFLLSCILLSLDLFEFISTFTSIVKYSNKYPIEIFDDCIKYQSIAQAFFAAFGSFAAISACILSLGLIISFDYFIEKLLETFIYYNYVIFGPYLLASCFLGGYYFKQIAYVCDSNQEKYLHFTMVISLCFSFIISVSLTIIYSMATTTSLLYNSIRFQRDGNFFIGKLFWYFIQNRVRNSFNMEINANENGRNNNNLQRDQTIVNQEIPQII